MKSTPARSLLVALALVVGSAPTARAAHGVVDLSWGTCAPVVASIASPAAGSLSLIASQLGNDQFHTAYQVRFHVGSEILAFNGAVPVNGTTWGQVKSAYRR